MYSEFLKGFPLRRGEKKPSEKERREKSKKRGKVK
jgi:hypothetical protein